LRLEPRPSARSASTGQPSAIHAVPALEHLEEGGRTRELARVVLGATALGGIRTRRRRPARATSLHHLSWSERGPGPSLFGVALAQLPSRAPRQDTAPVQLVRLEPTVACSLREGYPRAVRSALRDAGDARGPSTSAFEVLTPIRLAEVSATSDQS